jgi:hypothetical protein
MPIEPAIQANFERNIIWERSWPRCILAIIAIVELMLGLVKLLLEFLVCIQSFINFRLSWCRKFVIS